MRRGRHIPLLYCALVALRIPAQEAEPDDPGIVLPPVLLEVEDLQVEQVDAALPVDEDQLRPEISIPLPEAEELYLPEEVFDIPYPDQVGVTPGEGETNFSEYIQSPSREIFSDGRIGVGAPIYVLGDLVLYKLGDSPRFTLNFLHEKLDGYGFVNLPGSGYFNSIDILDGSISFELEKTNVEIQGEIAEKSYGLQGNPSGSYDSITYRTVSGVATANHEANTIFSLFAQLDGSYLGQILTSTAPVISAEFALMPSLRGTVSFDSFDLSLFFDYGLVSTTNPLDTNVDHRIHTGIALRYFSPADIQIYLDTGMYWSAMASLLPDVAAGLIGNISTSFQFQAEAGYVAGPQLNLHAMARSPYLELAALAPLSGFYGDVAAQMRPIPTLLFATHIRFSLLEGLVDPNELFESDTGLFAYTDAQKTTLQSDIEIEWTISRYLGLELGWYAKFIERRRFTPVQSIALSLTAEDPSERFGVLFDAGVDFMPEVSLPRLSLGGYYRISDSVRFQLDVSDALSPLESGRTDWDPYIEPGLNATLTTSISL